MRPVDLLAHLMDAEAALRGIDKRGHAQDVRSAVTGALSQTLLAGDLVAQRLADQGVYPVAYPRYLAYGAGDTGATLGQMRARARLRQTWQERGVRIDWPTGLPEGEVTSGE